jgi:hypothetical protein
MDTDDPGDQGYSPDVDRDADPHDQSLGASVPERSYRQLFYELRTARNTRDLVDTIRRYSWVLPLASLLLYGLTRGVFEFLTEPFAMSQGYTFTGWQIAAGINVLFGLFVSGFTWFLFFGVVGAIAGFFSDVTKLDTTMFKVGGYLSVLFVPVVVVSWFIALTIPAPDAVVAGAEPTTEVIETHRSVANASQMRLIDTMLSVTWIVIGFLLLPIVSELYDISSKQSVLSVLPVTLIAVVGTQLA